ncbi:NAC domain-containing protein 89, partial [Linum perenne]
VLRVIKATVASSFWLSSFLYNLSQQERINTQLSSSEDIISYHIIVTRVVWCRESMGSNVDYGGVSRETQMSIEASSMFPGFRFSPTDVELISYYLHRKIHGYNKCVEVIPQVEFCKHEPWDLPAKSVIKSDTEWFFFSSRGRKYPNGSQSKRATELGYWKATGKERNVRSGSSVIGTKRTLVFHLGRAPKGERTEWIMHEYSMPPSFNHESLVVCRLKKNVDFRGNHSCNNGFADESADQRRVMESTGAGDCSKKTSSSSASYSNEQFDSFSNDSEYKLSNNSSTPAAAESSTRHDLGLLDDLCQGGLVSSGCEDDCYYADILNDDIIKLDETCLTNRGAIPVSTGLAANVPEVRVGDGEANGEEDELPLWLMSQQGTASRRVKLGSRIRVGSVVAVNAAMEEEEVREKQRKATREKVKLSYDVGSLMMLARENRHVALVMFGMMIVGLVCMLVSISWKGGWDGKVISVVRRTAHLSSLAFRSYRGNCGV